MAVAWWLPDGSWWLHGAACSCQHAASSPCNHANPLPTPPNHQPTPTKPPQAAKLTCARKAEERKAELASRKQQLSDVLADNDQLRATVASQALSRADVNRLLGERGKLKGVLDSVKEAREGLERRAYQQELTVEGTLKELEESVRQYNLASHRLALIPASAKRAGGTNFELAVARTEETPQGLVSADIKVGGCWCYGGGHGVLFCGAGEGGH